MTGLRKLIAQDIIDIRESLVEGNPIPDNVAQYAENSKIAFTYVQDDEVIACCGALFIEDVWDLWAMYSNKATVFTRLRALEMFYRELRSLWNGEPAKFSIPSDMPNGDRYARAIGGVFVRNDKSVAYPGTTNYVYEVA